MTLLEHTDKQVSRRRVGVLHTALNCLKVDEKNWSPPSVKEVVENLIAARGRPCRRPHLASPLITSTDRLEFEIKEIKMR